MKTATVLLLGSLLSACSTTPRYVKDNHSYYNYQDNSIRTITTNTTETYHYHDKKRGNLFEEDEDFLQFHQGKVKADSKGKIDIEDLGF